MHQNFQGYCIIDNYKISSGNFRKKGYSDMFWGTTSIFLCCCKASVMTQLHVLRFKVIQSHTKLSIVGRTNRALGEPKLVWVFVVSFVSVSVLEIMTSCSQSYM